jgi:hypothetical protein
VTFVNIRFDSNTLTLRHRRNGDLLIHPWNQFSGGASVYR